LYFVAFNIGGRHMARNRIILITSLLVVGLDVLLMALTYSVLIDGFERELFVGQFNYVSSPAGLVFFIIEVLILMLATLSAAAVNFKD
jgi:hypothetical protein